MTAFAWISLLWLLPCVSSLSPLDTRQGEPADVRAWFGVPPDAQPPWPIQRFQNINHSVAVDLITRGVPFVVEDGTRDWPMAKWDCEYFTTAPEFSGARIRREYDPKAKGDKNLDAMNNVKWPQMQKKIQGADKAASHGGPQFQPFYWDVVKAARDEKHRGWGKDIDAQIEHIQRNTRVPYFLEKEPNLEEMQELY